MKVWEASLALASLLLIEGFYLYLVLSQLEKEISLPPVVRIALPVIAAGITIAMLPPAWKALRRMGQVRRRRIRPSRPPAHLVDRMQENARGHLHNR